MTELDRRREVVGVYQRVTAIIWQRLSPTFGIRTVNAIARNVIVRGTKTHPSLALIKVGEDGLEWGELEAKLAEVDGESLHLMLDSLLDEFFDALANLIGKLVMGKIFKEAEEMARKGSSE